MTSEEHDAKVPEGNNGNEGKNDNECNMPGVDGGRGDGKVSEHVLELSGMSCGACERIIRKIAEGSGAKAKAIDANAGIVVIEADEGKLAGIKAQLSERGFFEKGKGRRGDFSRFYAFCSKVVSGDASVSAESSILTNGIASISVLVLLSSLFYMFYLNSAQSGFSFLLLLPLVVIASVAIAASYFHSACYRESITCQNGMMVGMGIGMLAGFMVGAVVGATNGMFIGSVLGVAVGEVVGVGLGRHCGSMGALEGIMAALMSGTMGAMLSVMMLRDNLLAFLYLLFALCTVVLAGLAYMLYREQGPAPKELLEVSGPQFFAHAFWLFALMLAIMFFGPKAALVFP
ncbi:Uncharacterised protein [uncultured archaeon]|nr:Uncharacterised protein [uncultured archaeon]